MVKRPQLSPALTGKFKLAKNAGAGEYHWKGYQFNLSTVPLDLAEVLAAAGCPYLVRIKNRKTTRP
jgi:hypothetical protein